MQSAEYVNVSLEGGYHEGGAAISCQLLAHIHFRLCHCHCFPSSSFPATITATASAAITTATAVCGGGCNGFLLTVISGVGNMM